jgi:hypothetical protein
MFGINPALLLQKIRVPYWPPEAIAIVKSWRKVRGAKSAASEAAYLQRSALLENRTALTSRAAFIARDKRDAYKWTDVHEAALIEAEADVAEATAELAAFDAEQSALRAATISNRPRASFRGHEIPFVPSAEDWFKAINRGDFFAHVAPPAIKSKDIPAFHDGLVGDAEKIMTGLADLEAAPLPLEDALAKYRREVAALAAGPQVGPLFRAHVREKNRFVQAGRTIWPETPISMLLPATVGEGDVMIERENGAERGIAMLAALFPEKLLECGEKLIRAKAKAFTLAPIPLAERPKRLVELQGALLEVHRQIEAAESAMKSAKVRFEAFPYQLHPLAVLRVAPDKSPRPVAPEGSLIADAPPVPTKVRPSFSGGLLK